MKAHKANQKKKKKGHNVLNYFQLKLLLSLS